jgi:hypothetical protein
LPGMASVIQLARYRSVARRDIPLDIPAGDSDLRAIAIVLWVASVIRVALAMFHDEAFGAESTLALGCILVLPLLALRSRHARDTAQQ